MVTVSTGEGSLIADLAPRLGLELPPIPARRARAIAAAMPTLGHLDNPIDPWGAGEGAPTYRATFDAFADSGAYDVSPSSTTSRSGRSRARSRSRWSWRPSSSPRRPTGPRSCRSSSR